MPHPGDVKIGRSGRSLPPRGTQWNRKRPRDSRNNPSRLPTFVPFYSRPRMRRSGRVRRPTGIQGMGYEIVYCASCQVQIRGADLEKRLAIRIDDHAYCSKCAPGILKSLSPEKADVVLGRVPSPPPIRKGSTSRIAKVQSKSSGRLAAQQTPSPPPAPPPPAPKKNGLLIASAAGAAVLVGAVIVVMATSGTPAPGPAEKHRETAVAAEPKQPAKPAENLAGQKALVDLEQLASSSSPDPLEILIRCDEIKSLVRGTPQEGRWREIQDRAIEAKKVRDADQAITLGLEQVRSLRKFDVRFEKQPEIERLLERMKGLGGPAPGGSGPGEGRLCPGSGRREGPLPGPGGLVPLLDRRAPRRGRFGAQQQRHLDGGRDLERKLSRRRRGRAIQRQRGDRRPGPRARGFYDRLLAPDDAASDRRQPVVPGSGPGRCRGPRRRRGLRDGAPARQGRVRRGQARHDVAVAVGRQRRPLAARGGDARQPVGGDEGLRRRGPGSHGPRAEGDAQRAEPDDDRRASDGIAPVRGRARRPATVFPRPPGVRDRGARPEAGRPLGKAPGSHFHFFSPAAARPARYTPLGFQERPGGWVLSERVPVARNPSRGAEIADAIPEAALGYQTRRSDRRGPGSPSPCRRPPRRLRPGRRPGTPAGRDRNRPGRPA